MWIVEFADACTPQVRNMHWRIASAICASVIQFSRSGLGHIEWSGRDRIRLSTRGAIADIRIDREQRRLLVIRLQATP